MAEMPMEGARGWRSDESERTIDVGQVLCG